MENLLWVGFYFMTLYALLPALISRIFGFRVFRRGRAEKEIALTFDDGPDPVYTPRLLDLLKRYNARGTFFLVGSHAEQFPDIVSRIHEEGHVIGIHNYYHRSNWIMRPKTVKKHIFRTSDIIKRITGVRPVYYRPPWGIVNLFDYRRLGHLQIVLWTGMFGDWKARVGAEKLYRRMRRKMGPGEVFVLHDCGRTFGADEEAPAHMIEALERILQDGKKEGYRFIGVDEMIALTEANRRAGTAVQNDSAAEAGKEVVMTDSHHPGRETNGEHRIGAFKKAVVSIWMLWEKTFHVLFRLRPIGDGSSFHYRIRKYSGPEVRMKDGKSLNKGDLVMELHFENRMLFDLGMNSRSSMHTAIRLIREVEKVLPEMARTLEHAPRGDKVTALYGVSMINRGAEGLGFQTFDLPKSLFSWSANWYLKFMLSVIHPDGGKRVREHGERLSPRMLLMDREELLAWKNRTGRQRNSRSGRSERSDVSAPAAAAAPLVESGMKADHMSF